MSDPTSSARESDGDEPRSDSVVETPEDVEDGRDESSTSIEEGPTEEFESASAGESDTSETPTKEDGSASAGESNGGAGESCGGTSEDAEARESGGEGHPQFGGLNIDIEVASEDDDEDLSTRVWKAAYNTLYHHVCHRKPFEEYQTLLHLDYERSMHPEAQEWATIALSPPNDIKNRYGSVLPSVQHRVKLEAKPARLFDDEAEDDSGYINASHIDVRSALSFHDESVLQFIAAQAPLTNTIGDFYQMIVEQNVTVVLMLTRTFEDGRPKANAYWPEDAGQEQTFGTCGVKMASEQIVNEDTILRELSILKRGRTHHDMLDMLEHALESHRSQPAGGKLLVHCSAGIGRTGTFVAVYSAMKSLEFQCDEAIARLENDADEALSMNFCMASIVDLVRTHRPGSITQPEQYEFCYKAVLHWIAAQGEFSPRKITYVRSKGAHKTKGSRSPGSPGRKGRCVLF